MPNPFEEFGGIADSDLYKENPSQANADPFAEFGGFSDSSINGTAQQQSSVNKRITTPSKPNPTVVQTPVLNTPKQAQQTIPEPAPQPLYANNGVIQGGIANEPDYAKPQNAFLANIDDKIKQQAKLNLEKRAAWEKAHPIISDFQKSLQPNYSANALDWEKKAQYGAVSPLKENLQNQFKQIRSNIAPSVNLATLGVGGEYAFTQGAKILNNASKFKPAAQFIASHPYLSKWASVAPFTMAEGAGWGIADKALRNASGVESNESWKDAAIGGAATMGLLHGGIMGGAALANNIAKSSLAKAAAKAYNNLLNSNTPIGNRLANIQGTLADTLGLDTTNETARKYQKLNRDISRGNTPLEKRLSKADVEELEASKNLTKKQQDLIFDRLKNGEPKKSTVTKEQEDAKEFFDNLLKEEEANIKPEHAGDDLSQVKQETDTSLPEHIETPLKIDSDMSGDRYKINLRNQKSDKQNYFKIQQEKWKRQQQRMDAEKHQPEFNQKEYKAKVERIRARMEAAKEGNIVKFDEDGLEALGKEMGDWVHPPKKTGLTKLEPGKAEGSDSNFWYEQKTKPKTKGLEADDAYIKPNSEGNYVKEAQGDNYENYVDENYTRSDLAPEDTASLQNEIDAFNKAKAQEPARLRDKKQHKVVINQEAKKAFGVSSFLNSAKSSKLIKALSNPNKQINAKLFINRLCVMSQSQQTKRALEVMYHHSPDELREFIQRKIKANNLPYEMTSQLYVNKKVGNKIVEKGISSNKISNFDKCVENLLRKYSGNSTVINAVDKIKAIRQKASSIHNAAEYTNINKSVSDYFNLNEQNKLKDIDLVFVNEYPNAGEFFENFNTAIIKTKNNNGIELSTEQINKTVRHELQHSIDIPIISALEESNPVKIELNRYYENYEKAIERLTPSSYTSKVFKECFDEIENINPNAYKELYKAIENQEINISNVDKFKDIANNVYGKGNIKADIICDYLDNIAVYYSHPFEKRAFKAASGIKNTGDILNEIQNFVNEYREWNIRTNYNGKVNEETLRSSAEGGRIYQIYPGQKQYKQNRQYKSLDFGEIDNVRLGENGKTIQGLSELKEQQTNNIIAKDKELVRNDANYERRTQQERIDRLGVTSTDKNRFEKESRIEKDIRSSGSSRLAPTPQSFIKSIKNSSKAQEQIKIDFDIITEEQAANRLKQQSGGEGVYFKQGYGKSDSKIDLTKNYNESRDNKVGHFGEKIKDGLANGSTTKDILLETKKEEIKVQHLKDSIDFIESEFAKALPESGNASKGYVAVNRNLLANAIYGKKSTAWYEMMAGVNNSNGEDAIRKAFKNEKVAQNWIDLANRNSKPDYQIPEVVFNKLFDGSGETVAEYWERYGKDHTSKAIAKTGGAILDAFNNSFKRGVLTSASFVFNNRFGNQMMIAAKSNPVEYIKSFYQAGKLKNKDLPEEIIESSLLEAVEGYKARQTYTGWQPLDNFLNLCGGHTIDTSTLKTMKAASDNGFHFQVIKGKTIPKKMIESHNTKSLAAEAANICIGMPNKAFNKLCDKLMRFNEAMERFERKQVYGIQMDRVKKDIVKRTGQNMLTQEEFLSHLKNHPELEETIVKNIEDTLGDYNNFNKFEKKVLKRIVPFYSWYRTISRHTVTLAKENPARCAMIFLELERLKDKDEDLKEWQKGAIRTGLYDSRSNRELLVNKTAQIPYSTFKEFVDESGRGGLSPAVKKPLEAIRGKQFFNDSEITSKRYKKSKKGWGVNAKEGYLDKKTGTFKEGELPLMPRFNYLGKEALNTVYPALRSPLLKPEATAQGISNLILNGEYKEPDKLYDSDLGGYNKNDLFWGNEKRWAANDTSAITKTLNRILGLSLQNKQPLSKSEREALKEKYLRQYKRMNKY